MAANNDAHPRSLLAPIPQEHVAPRSSSRSLIEAFYVIWAI